MIKLSVHEVKRELRIIMDGATAQEIANQYDLPDYRDLIFDITENEEYYDQEGNIQIESVSIPTIELLHELLPYGCEPIHIPDESIEEWEGMYYYVQSSFQIPELIPLLDQIDQDKLTISHTGGCYQTLEFVYLPTSDLIHDANEELREVAKQPGSFMLAIQDEGYHTYEHFLKFYMEVKALGLYIQRLISESKGNVKEMIVAAA